LLEFDSTSFRSRPTAKVLASARLVAETPKKKDERSARRRPRSPQILRQCRIIFGEFLVSFTCAHARTRWLND
jgi:hypothetical protein